MVERREGHPAGDYFNTKRQSLWLVRLTHGWERVRCPRCRRELTQGAMRTCPSGHGGFLPAAAPADRPAPPLAQRVDEPPCPSCGMPMDPLLVDDGEALVASCQRCRGVWVGVGDARAAADLLQTLG